MREEMIDHLTRRGPCFPVLKTLSAGKVKGALRCRSTLTGEERIFLESCRGRRLGSTNRCSWPQRWSRVEDCM